MTQNARISIFVTGLLCKYMRIKDTHECGALVTYFMGDQASPGLQDTRSEHDAGTQHWWACRLSLGLYAQAVVFCCFWFLPYSTPSQKAFSSLSMLPAHTRNTPYRRFAGAELRMKLTCSACMPGGCCWLAVQKSCRSSPQCTHLQRT